MSLPAQLRFGGERARTVLLQPTPTIRESLDTRASRQRQVDMRPWPTHENTRTAIVVDQKDNRTDLLGWEEPHRKSEDPKEHQVALTRGSRWYAL